MIAFKRALCGLFAAAGLLTVRCGSQPESSSAPDTTAVTEQSATDSLQPDSGSDIPSSDAGTAATPDSTAAADQTAADGNQTGSTAARTTEAASRRTTGSKSAPAQTTPDTVKTNDDGLIEFPYIEIR